MSKQEIVSTLSAHLPHLKAVYHVKKIGLFGSVVREDAGEGSDVDVVAEFETPVGFFDFIRLENYLSGVLKKKVDLVSLRAIKPAIKDDILKEVLYV